MDEVGWVADWEEWQVDSIALSLSLSEIDPAAGKNIFQAEETSDPDLQQSHWLEHYWDALPTF